MHEPSPENFALRAFAIDTEHDQTKVLPHNGNDPRPPLVV